MKAFEDIERIVGEHFNVPVEQLVSGGNTRDITDARHFLWYILNTIMGFNGTMISKHYGVTTRNVFYSVALIRDGIKNQPFYSKHMAEIQEQLKDLISL